MRSSIVVSVLSALVVGTIADGPVVAEAPVAHGNPEATYVAALTPTGAAIQGSVIAKTGPGGAGVKYTVQLSGLKKEEALPYSER